MAISVYLGATPLIFEKLFPTRPKTRLNDVLMSIFDDLYDIRPKQSHPSQISRLRI